MTPPSPLHGRPQHPRPLCIILYLCTAIVLYSIANFQVKSLPNNGDAPAVRSRRVHAIDAAPDNSGLKNGRRSPRTLQFDCSQLINSTVVREIATGKQKTTYEVILPNNVHVAAKRCHSDKCISKRKSARIFTLFLFMLTDAASRHF